MVYLTPGPTELHPLAKSAIHTAISSDICAISHRSKQYEEIQADTEQQLRTLLSIPNDFSIFFLSSGTEAWERIIQNGVSKTSLHLTNGSFSKRFFETSLELGKSAKEISKPLGQGFDLGDLPASISEELLCLTQNETSTGAALPAKLVEQVRAKNPDVLIAIDAVSCAPIPMLDIATVDYHFFSVQKFFGLPAGLGVLSVSPRAMEKARSLRAKSEVIGAHHSLLSLESFSKKHQTPTTPNVLAIYTLGKVAKSFNQIGIEKLRSETEQKARIIYECLNRHAFLKAFVVEERWRSQTVITVDSGAQTAGVVKTLADNDLIVGSGYGPLKDSQFRIANFAAHSVETFKKLATLLSA